MLQTIKALSHRLLCNDLSGSVVKAFCKNKIPDIRWQKFQFDVTDAGMSNSMAASIFWGFYEAAEIRFVEKYIKGDMDVIELGASSGIVSSHIVSKLSPNNRLISVEANKALRSTWLKNTDRHNAHGSFKTLLNCAIYYDDDHVSFNSSDNTTESSIGNPGSQSSLAMTVPARKLSSLLEDFKIKSYALVCDIEGAEVGILINDGDVFSDCRMLLIELHSTEYKNTVYDVEFIKDLVIKKGFSLTDQHGNVFLFTK
jgi:FkbM family methyltransferase